MSGDPGRWHSDRDRHEGREQHEWRERHRHDNVIIVNPALQWPGYAPFNDPWYGWPPPTVMDPPPAYVERPEASLDTAPPGKYWYYCESAGAYYPYVKACPEDWKLVEPQPQ